MADNTQLGTPVGSGDVIATDDIAGVKHQQVKVEWGVDGVATPVSAANPMPVVQTGAHTVTANAGSGTFAVGDGGGSLTVDGSVSIAGSVDTELPAAAALGDNTANPTVPGVGAFAMCWDGANWDRVPGNSTGVAVQDGGNSLTVDATSWPLPTGAATSAAQLPDGHNVTVDNASGASAVNIQDGGNSITIDGTVTVGSLPNEGQQTMANSISVAVASDQSVLNIATSVGSNVNVEGEAAHDIAVSGNPLLTGFEARTTNPTAVASGDAVRGIADDLGRQVIVPHQVRDLVITGRQTLSSTTETTVIAQAASTFHDLVLLTLSNSSATGVRVDIRDTTGGTVLMSFFLAADGGGAVVPFPVPQPQATVNTNWTAQLSAAVTDVRVSMMAVKNV